MADEDQNEAPAEQATQESPAEQERRVRRAELAAHPHTQLRGILSDLNSPAARSSDINTKHAMLHAGVTRLINQVLAHTPSPNDSEEKINADFERQQQHAEGSDKQKPASD